MLIGAFFLMLAALNQEVPVQSTDQGVLVQSGPVRRLDRNVRQALMPGKPDKQIKPVKGFSCRHFLGYSEAQMHVNVQMGDRACSGEIFPDHGFRQVNYLRTSAGSLMVVIYSPRDRIDAASRVIIYLNGGPRSITTNRPLAQQLVAKGYTVLMPVYLGELETLHPAPDMPGAVEQIRALTRWAGDRLVATVGISTGAYLAAAACTAHCPPRILLAPPLTTPEDVMSDKRVDWSKLTDGSCLWRHNGPHRVCAEIETFLKSFWGERYYRTSLTSLLRGQCARVRIVVSPDDTRVYDPKGIADLRSAGCAIETPAGYQHAMVDASPVLNERTLALIARQEAPRPAGQMQSVQ
ncbi:hypothetical protein P6144_19160 [Sphingomonas sp. HITSZ_GF]|uniref:hypothetical protein n=1 Tax=Sphingomonas sp. HITSZ_GF TaxID=3037247 RepID=UPI00240E419C|nr:hypothetical protein [Sphingomonas sp. HITSZ_GF]MDG2535789.1 hypothetical protein [Sphingomonas sp. HITSZ_GF]